MAFDRELEVALAASVEAGRIALRYFGDCGNAITKADGSPLTQADLEIESSVVSSIREHFPHHGFLTEEGISESTAGDYVWVIDPIDGTKNFVRGIGLFAVQIGLLYRGEPALGVSNAPALKELLYASAGGGAYQGGAKLHVSPISDISEASLSHGNVLHFSNTGTLPCLISLAKSVRQCRGIGDAWSYHLLAQGKIDAMVDARTCIWDIAAAAVIVREAGGKMSDFSGKPITVDTRSVVATNARLHESILRSFPNGNREEARHEH
jgi:histidinol-phosphatase